MTDMSEEDQLKQRLGTYLKLATTSEGFQELYDSSKESFDKAQVGSGWFPSEIAVDAYAVRNIPVEAAVKAAEAKKPDIFAVLMLFRRPKPESVSLLDRKIRWQPFWIVSGLHWCLFFRGGRYKIPVSEDIVAISVNSHAQDLYFDEEHEKLKPTIPDELKGLASNVGSILAPTEKYFILSEGVTELAYHYDEATLYLDTHGRISTKIEKIMSLNLSIFKVSSHGDLKVKGIKTEVSEPMETKEGIVKNLHDRIVHRPKAFRKILENCFEVTRLQLVYVPVYTFQCQYRDKLKELQIDGVTGEFMKP